VEQSEWQHLLKVVRMCVLLDSFTKHVISGLAEVVGVFSWLDISPNEWLITYYISSHLHIQWKTSRSSVTHPSVQ
jgi:hypothetical protein